MNKIIDICGFHTKSKIKAGEGLLNGRYPFYTSSNVLNKHLNSYEIEKEGIILGTGGNASIHYCSGKFSASTDCLVMYSKSEKVDNEYLYYYLLNSIHILENGFRGAGLKHISKKYIEDIKIDYIPDIEIQKKIINSINLSKDLINKRKEQIEILDQLVESRFIEMFGDPITNSFDNKTKQLKEVAKLERGKFTPRPRNDPKYFNGEFPFIQTGDISRCNHRLYKYSSTLNEKGIKVSKKFNIGTIVIALVGATIGMTAILEREVYATDSIVGITTYDNIINNVFLEMVLRAWRKPLLDMAPEAARANINIGILEKLPIIIPEIKKQNEFESFINQVYKLKFEMENSLKELEDNFNSLMQRAFKGELFN